jgi:hypothetical protein
VRGLKGLLSTLFPREEARYYNVIGIVRHGESGLYTVHRAHNIITDAGDVHAAQKLASETPTNTWDTLAGGRLYIYSASITPVKGSTFSTTNLVSPSAGQSNETNYPKSNDTDADNTGKGTEVCTRKYLFNAASFNNATCIGACIAKASAIAADPLYAAWDFTSFAKGSTDTLTVFHNTDTEGV